MRVILDTNVMHDDFYFRKGNVRVLLESAVRAGHEVYVPMVVLDEFIAQFYQQLHTLLHTLNKAAHRWVDLRLDALLRKNF